MTATAEPLADQVAAASEPAPQPQNEATAGEVPPVSPTPNTQKLDAGPSKIPPKAPLTREELAERWEAINAQRDEIRRLEVRESETKDAHSAAKKALEAAQDRLCEMIDEYNVPTDGDLFRAHEQSQREAAAAMNDHHESSDEQARMDAEDNKAPDGKPKADPDGWRFHDIGDLVALGMQNRAESALRKAGINTIGDLADRQEQGELRIPGVAPSGPVADSMERALTKFWAQHPEYCKAQPAN